MAIVARHGAQPLNLVITMPGFRAACPEIIEAAYSAIHERQARVTAHDDVFHLIVEQNGHEPASLVDALQTTVVTAVQPALCKAILGFDEHRQHVHRQVELFGRRFSARHVQIKIACLVSRKLILELDLQGSQISGTQICIAHICSNRIRRPFASRGKPFIPKIRALIIGFRSPSRMAKGPIQ